MQYLEKDKKEHPGDGLRYISLRTTIYAMFGLAKVAANSKNEWNIAYSGF